MTQSYLVSLSLGWEADFNGSELIFVQIVQQHIHDVGRLACASRPHE